jgi:putative restriction endonuclease
VVNFPGIPSHIIPWSSKIETRLSPHNGLSLSILYDSLFDKGCFTINEANEVILTSIIDSFSNQIQQWLAQISGKKLASPKKYEISKDALAYHKNNIFDRFNG